MVELNVDDILQRLRDLACYSPGLATPMEHEDDLPEDAVSYLVDKIQSAYRACETATPAAWPEAQEELTRWLTYSYRFYLARLLMADNPWVFRFPKAAQQVGAWH